MPATDKVGKRGVALNKVPHVQRDAQLPRKLIDSIFFMPSPTIRQQNERYSVALEEV